MPEFIVDHVKLRAEKIIKEDKTNRPKAPIKFQLQLNEEQKEKGFLKTVLIDVWNTFKTIFPYVLLGVGSGALIHGYVPVGFFEKYLVVYFSSITFLVFILFSIKQEAYIINVFKTTPKY